MCIFFLLNVVFVVLFKRKEKTGGGITNFTDKKNQNSCQDDSLPYNYKIASAYSKLEVCV